MRTILAAAAAAALLLAGRSAHAQLSISRPLVRPRPIYTVAPRTMAPRTMAPRTTSASQGTTRAVSPAPRPGRLACTADENGIYAPASVQIRAAGRLLASGSCASPHELPPGAYDAVITLESALDRPTRTVRVIVPEGGLATARASFATATLEVRFTSDRAPVPGLAVIERDGVAVGTLGSGVSARLSPGTYTIVARYRTSERRYTVTLEPEQRRALRAAF